MSAILLRATITETEYRELKVIALRRNQAIQDLIADALRDSPLTANAFTKAEGSSND